MTIYRNIFKKHKKRTKSLMFLLVVIILALIFNTSLLKIFNEYSDKDNNEKDLDNENPLLSSDHPNNACDYNYYKEITINHSKVSGPDDLIDFPVLISIFDSDLHDKAQVDGDDIAFAIGFEWLDHEIELFNRSYSPTHAQLVAWIRAPILSQSTDTIIRMYYGNPYIDSRENPEGVWNSNYEAVWHMNQDPSSSDILDSTANNNDLTTTGFASDTRFYDGKLGTAIAVDGTNDRFGISSFNGPINDFTFQTWFKFDNPFPGSEMYFYQGNSPASSFPLLRFTSSGVVVTHIEVTSDNDESCVGTKNSWAGDTWFQFVNSRSMSAVRSYHYIDGSLDAEDNSADNANPHIPWDRLSILGGLSGSNMWGPGAISEFRILTITLSPDWIATEHNNQYSPNSFYNISSEIKYLIASINDFEYFKEIVIDHTKVSGSSNLINFPLLISILDSDLHDYVQPDGDDIAFNNGTSWLFHEIELFNQNYNSTHAQLIAWVSVPVLSPSIDTVLYMYYGNSTMNSQQTPTRVWDSNYIGIWHLGEVSGGSLAIKDSTQNGNDGTDQGTPELGAPGQIGGAFGIDEWADFVDVPDSSSLDRPSSSITISGWTYAENYIWNMAMLSKNEFKDSPYGILYRNSSNIISYNIEGVTTNYVNSDVSITRQGWMYLVLTYDGSNVRIYKDGLFGYSSSQTGTIAPNSLNLQIGREEMYGDWFYGVLDEIRISDSVRSTEWVATEYNNQYDPNSFYSISNAIKVDENAPSDASYFNHYKVITIDSLLVFGSGYHSNFPVLISIYDQDLRSGVQQDGDDIAFSLGSEWLDHEIEIFNQNYNGTHAELVAWVRIPELSTSLDTFIRMYYGNSTMSSRENPTGVWDESYKGVWHLSESSGFTQDSTLYNENGLVTGTLIRPSTGQIGNAYNY
ncbi:MAG: DUF2341 domain-containing protein, partial [Candidatus Thorarchaeota archaeon]